LFLPLSGVHHDGIENPANQQNDQEVDQRECRSRTKVELTHCNRDQKLAEECGGRAGPAARKHEGFGIDHETVHEAQQDTDHEDRLHFRKLDKPENERIIVVMLSTSKNPEYVKKANEINEVSEFTSKPLTTEYLEEIREKYFSK